MSAVKWYYVFERDNGICFYCERDLVKDYKLFFESTIHYVSTRGGTDSLDSYVLCCKECKATALKSLNLINVSLFDDMKAYYFMFDESGKKNSEKLDSGVDTN
jgi:hypothetical protein